MEVKFWKWEEVYFSVHSFFSKVKKKILNEEKTK